MKTSIYITILGLAALVAANPFNCAPTSTVAVTSGDGYSILSPNAIPVTNAPVSRSTTTTDSLSDCITILIINIYGTQLSVSFDSDVGGPSLIGNPSATVLPNALLTQYAFPAGWAGRIYIGPNTNPFGSKIEGSIISPPNIDISYIDGYSVPITCSSNGVAVSGCNIDLFKQPGIIYNNQIDGPVCLNSVRNIAGRPTPPFFAACAGAAYTYPNDNNANISNLRSNLISYYINILYKAPLRQLLKRGYPTPKQPV